MKVFTTIPGSFVQIKRKVVPTMIAIYSGLFLVVIVIPEILSNEPTNWKVMIGTLCIFTVVITLATINVLVRYRKGFESFKLTIDAQKIIREQHNLPLNQIMISDVTRIVRNSNGSFAVIGKSKLNAIGIPSQVENYAELQSALEGICPIEFKSKKPLIERMFIPLALSGGLLIAANMMFVNDVVDLFSSILLVIMMLGGFVTIQISKNVDYSTRRMSWIFLLPAIAYIVNIVLLLQKM